MKHFIVFFLVVSLVSCKNESKTPSQFEETPSIQKKDTIKKPQRPIAFDNGKFFEIDGRKMLYGGEDSIQHFDITDYDLKDQQFHYGIGREHFPALLVPEFTTIEAVDSIWKDDDRFILAYSGDDIKAYSVKDLTEHEVVNDVLNGEPIMAVYCILADLGAIYDRQYGDKELTFALSGYTYYDDEVWDGLDGFVLWDRETESLWWPLIDKAVSGTMMGTDIKKHNTDRWFETTWGEIKALYPETLLLKPGQSMDVPSNWPKYSCDDLLNR